MATTVSLNGVSYDIPATGENSWGDAVSSYLIALGSGVLQKAGGSFTLTAETDFGATYGLKSTYYKSRATNPATAGVLRLGNAEYIYWRNAANSGNLGLRVNSSDALEFNGVPLSALAFGTANQVLGMNNGATAQEYKDVLGTSNQVTVTHGANSITLSTPQSIGTGSSPTFAGLTLSGVTASRALTTNGSSVITASAVTSTELGYLSGVTSPTGSGALVLATSPTLVTPTIGVATATSVNKVAITAPVTSATLTIADGKTATFSNTLTFTGTDASSVAFGAGGTVLYSGGSPTLAALTISGLTASKAVVTDGSKGLASSAVTSTELGYLSGVTSPTGSGALVLATTPTLVTPVLGVATATSINKVAITAPATGSTLTIADGKTLTASNTLTFTGTDSSSVAFGAGGTVVYTSNKLSALSATTSAELAGVISDETGSGALVFGTTPTIATPNISTSLSMTAAAEIRYYNAGGTFYTGFKGGNAAANKIWTLPLADGSNGQAIKTDGAGNLSFGTVSGSGAINYVTESDFEDNAVTGWATYADAAATTPVDGTGGAPSSTFAATSSSPLRGTYSGLFTKGAANRQGEGFSYAFTIASADKSRPLAISWEGSASANYTGSSGSEYMSVYVYDVTNATLITPVSTTVSPGTTKGYTTFLATTSTSYRLIFHVAGTGTSAWTYTIDSVSVSPTTAIQGAAVGDVNITSAAFSNITLGSAVYTGYRVGSWLYMEISGIVTGTVASTAKLSLPTGLTIDSTKLGASTNAQIVGRAWTSEGSTTGQGVETNGYGLVAIYDGSDTAAVYFAASTKSNAYTKVTGASFNSTTEPANFSIKVPISQWSSNSNAQYLQNADPEFASNSDTSNADDTTSFVYGAAGSGIPTSVANSHIKRVRFRTAIQPTDTLTLEIQASSGNWQPVNCVDSNLLIGSYIKQNGVDYGMCIATTYINSTDVNVQFGTYASANGATFGAAGYAWSSVTAGTKWRVRKSSGIGAGFAMSAANVYGRNDGNSASSGYIGEVVKSVQTSNTNLPGASGAYGDALSIALPSPGLFRIGASVGLLRNGATVTGPDILLGVSTTSGNSSTGLVQGINAIEHNVIIPTTFSSYSMICPSFVVKYDGTTITRVEDNVAFAAGSTLYMKLYFGSYSAATPQFTGKLTATRIG